MRNFEYRVGFLGCPARPEIAWDTTNLIRLKDLGFNTIQLNIAWGSRPGGEALNLEDLLDVPEDLRGAVEMVGDQSHARRERRRRELRDRIALCQQLGLRTIFHFGAPYVGDHNYGDAPPNCLRDEITGRRYVYLVEQLSREYPGIDDLLVYTYDQHSWMCSEFGPCPRCTGSPLHDRVIPFLESLKAAWRATHPSGRLWWEPWELSAGQVLKCVTRMEPEGFGLALHSNIAEVMASFPADRWLKNTVALAASRGIPSIAEYWLGGPSEELEPYTNLAYPLVTLRGLRALAAIPQLAGVKEYYGLLPDNEDPNLRMSGEFFEEPEISEEEALARVASIYGEAAGAVAAYWRETSAAMEMFPWETSWLIRAIGRANPAHSLSAAMVRGVSWHSPSWASTRRGTFMVVDTMESPDPWMLEDIQLRCELAAEHMAKALDLATGACDSVPQRLAQQFAQGMSELREFQRRCLAYAYHARETNLATSMREARRQGLGALSALTAEMAGLLKADRANGNEEHAIAAAVAMLESDLDGFLRTYFQQEPDAVSRGFNSVTSR